MQYYGFQHIFDEFSKRKKATKAEEHDIGKIRDKFTSIIDLVGIDTNLLRKHKDEKTGKMVSFDNSNRQFCFPETICDFCVEIIIRYPTSDFRDLRKGQYRIVPISVLNYLIDGFTEYLFALGYDYPTIAREKFKMKKRLKYDISVHLYELNQEFREIMENVKNYTNSIQAIYYEDYVYLTRYIVEKTKKFREHIESLCNNYTELRSEEFYRFAQEESVNISNSESLADIQQSSLLADALEHDKNYQTLLSEQMKILSTSDFIKNLKSSYNKNNEQLSAIRKHHIHELFGDKIQKTELTYNFTPNHPLYVLYDAIKLTDEMEQEQAELKEKNSSISKEQREKVKEELQKIYLQYFDLPEIEPTIQQIKEKGTIKYPCCSGEETIVYEGATGFIINKCPQCGKQVLFNLDDMTAEMYGASKGHMRLI